MKNWIHFLLLFISSIVFLQCNTAKTAAETSAKYDEKLAEELGADDYGMKTYVMAFLSRGDSEGLDSLERVRLQHAHLDNIKRLAEEGKLVLAGPFFGNDDLRGIYIFNVKTLEEARALTETDPSIQAGTLEMDLRLWYGSAALMKVNELHKKVAKKGI